MGVGLALQMAIVAATAAIIDDTDNDLLRIIAAGETERSKQGSIRRMRSCFAVVTQFLTDSGYKNAFRMSRGAFRMLLGCLYPYLLRNETMACRLSGGAIQPEVRLAITLRILAGGLYLDHMMCWGVGRSMTFRAFLETVQAIKQEVEMPGILLEDEAALRYLADGFQRSRFRDNPWYGCVGALDGIAISIRKPPDEYVPRNFYCRKGMYALPVQAVVDSMLRFRYMSCRCSGSIHDAVAFDSSDLAMKLRNGKMAPGYWIAGDAAYVPIPGLLTPWSKYHLARDGGIFADSFNFYHSSHRIHVEQAFGVLVQRWGLLWKPLQYHISEVLPIISAAMRLHNFCIEQDGESYLRRSTSFIRTGDGAGSISRMVDRIAEDLRSTTDSNQGTRRDVEASDLRQALTESLKERSIMRPAMS